MFYSTMRGALEQASPFSDFVRVSIFVYENEILT